MLAFTGWDQTDTTTGTVPIPAPPLRHVSWAPPLLADEDDLTNPWPRWLPQALMTPMKGAP